MVRSVVVFVFTFFFFSKIEVLGQELVPKMRIQVGAAIPAGDFGATRSLTSSGFAATGRSLGLGVLYPINSGFDLIAFYSNKRFSVNRDKYDVLSERRVRTELGNLVTENFRYTSTLGSYTNNNFTAGLKINWNTSEDVRFYFTPGITLSWLKVPSISIAVLDDNYEVSRNQQSDSPTSALSFSFSSGVEYSMSNDLDLLFDFGFVQSGHRPTIKVTAKDQNGTITRQETKEKLVFSAITFSLGLNFKLSGKTE